MKRLSVFGEVLDLLPVVYEHIPMKLRRSDKFVRADHLTISATLDGSVATPPLDTIWPRSEICFWNRWIVVSFNLRLACFSLLKTSSNDLSFDQEIFHKQLNHRYRQERNSKLVLSRRRTHRSKNFLPMDKRPYEIHFGRVFLDFPSLITNCWSIACQL